MAALPNDYRERVYAGWLGKCIGVRLGAPVETWTYDEIAKHLGEVRDFVPLAPGKIFKPDDDTAYPMLLIRALEDFGPNATAAQMGETLLNYLGDHHGTIWWGGDGACAEQTAYLHLKSGIVAPDSGSIARNGKLLAEQCGGQIFSDVWGLIAPNQPELAADYAERAASIAHDGEGLHGGRFIAALVSLAFSQRDPLMLIEGGLCVIPADSEYAHVTRAVMDIHRTQPDDWEAGYKILRQDFGYTNYAGDWHTIPNAAIVVMALLYGRGDFAKTLRIATNAGWDSDCSAGNAGAIIGVAVGLSGIDMHWRTAMNDLLVGASLTGARNLWNIPACADLFCDLGAQIAEAAPPLARPRFHFDYPGSTHGFFAYPGSTYGFPADARGTEVVGLRQVSPSSLQVAVRALGAKGEVRIAVKTYLRPSELSANYYGASFSPQIYPGQTITARVSIPADAQRRVLAALYVWDDNRQATHQATGTELIPGQWHTLTFSIPRLENALLTETGIVLRNLGGAWNGHLLMKSFDWSGAPDFSCDFSEARAEYGALSEWTFLRGFWRLEGAYHGGGATLSESYTGDPAWRDLSLEVDLVPLAGDEHNINLRVQGARRSYAVGLAAGNRLVIYKNVGAYHVVKEAHCPWEIGAHYRVRADVIGATIVASVNDRVLLEWTDTDHPYLNGQIGLSNVASHTRYERLSVRGYP
ncbi:MAG: ADP-ribosylglycohydrolase family protein [Proteobacteria bacterium]|nr:ADP-ribosylglycohydrolase family protein [Pseudomonadota bacterium]